MVDLHLDVFQMPSAKPAPVVVHLHGGGWTAPAGQSHSPGPFTALLAAGISVVSVQYRSSLEAPAPAALQDVHCVLSWVKANAAKYNFDLNRVILYGVSAGGELALMAAYAPDWFDPPGCKDQPKVAAVLDYYGPPDLAEAMLHEPGSGDFLRQWLGLAVPLPADSAVVAAANGAPARSAVAGTECRRRGAGEAVVANELHSAGGASNIYCERGETQGESGAGLEVEGGPGRGRGAGWARHYSRRRTWKFPKARGGQGVVVMSTVPEGPGDSRRAGIAIEKRGDAMRRRYAAALSVMLIVGAKEYAQQPAAAAPVGGGPAYLDPANWGNVHPTETDNIVYATVPHIRNPSAEASPNPACRTAYARPSPTLAPPVPSTCTLMSIRSPPRNPPRS